jgi:hypothetical protein
MSDEKTREQDLAEAKARARALRAAAAAQAGYILSVRAA